jgi:predicted 3-demethylubiquinone-9 3-methyltransferase (glyoxalase superfamily)
MRRRPDGNFAFGPWWNKVICLALVSKWSHDEVDHFWEKLSAGGEKQWCGWLKDKYGVSWQIIPRVPGQFLQDKDEEKSTRVMNAMMQMEKLDIAGLKKAYGQA